MATETPGVREGGLAFEEARGCKQWLATLPLTSVTQAQGLLTEGLRALNLSGLPALERLKCLELIRDKAAFLVGEQRARLAGKTLPFTAGDTAAWTGSRNLLAELESGYRGALADARAGGEAARHAALATQRIVRCAGAQLILHAIAYRRPEPGLWARLNAACLDAARVGFSEERVKDSLESEDGTSSVAEAWLQAALPHAVALHEASPADIGFIEALLRGWARKAQLQAEAPAELATALVADLAADAPPRAAAAGEGGVERRYVDTAQLSRSLRKRLHALKANEDPATLGLPAGYGDIDLAGLLARLHRAWCEGGSGRGAAGRAPADKTAGLVFGIPDIHFFVTGGKVFEPPDRERQMSAQEKQDIEVFGRVTARTQSRMMVEHNYTVEPWEALEESVGAFRLARPAGAMRGIAFGRLVAMRVGDTGAFYLGMVSALVQEPDGRIVATVTVFPGKPEALAVRSGGKWSEGFRLPALEKLRVPATVVMPGGSAHRGRGFQVWDGGARDVRVAEVVTRGADFDRVALA